MLDLLHQYQVFHGPGVGDQCTKKHNGEPTGGLVCN